MQFQDSAKLLYIRLFQSRNYNVHHGFVSNAVCKIQPGNRLKIFSFREFYNQLKECVLHGYEAVFDLTNTTAIR